MQKLSGIITSSIKIISYSPLLMRFPVDGSSAAKIQYADPYARATVFPRSTSWISVNSTGAT